MVTRRNRKPPPSLDSLAKMFKDVSEYTPETEFENIVVFDNKYPHLEGVEYNSISEFLKDRDMVSQNTTQAKKAIAEGGLFKQRFSIKLQSETD